MILTAGSAHIWVLVPVKRLDRAKSRLSPHLDSAERAMLASAMLRDVFDAIGGASDPVGILVITGDPDAAALARDAGAIVLDDPHETGTNDAVRQGIAWLSSRGVDGVAVIPGDIPFVTAGELEAVFSAMRSDDLVVVPATRDGGTNVLAMSPPDLIAPSFGSGSFAKHRENAAATGITPSVLILEGAGHDIDVAGDLVLSAVPDGGRRTRGLLAGLNLSDISAASKPQERISPC